MIELQIDNPTIEKSLKSKFHTNQEINQYIDSLILEDLEDKSFLSIVKDSHKKNFVSKNEILSVLDHK